MIDPDQIYFFAKEAALPSYTKQLQMGAPGKSLAQLASKRSPGATAVASMGQVQRTQQLRSRAFRAGRKTRRVFDRLSGVLRRRGR